MGSSPSHEVFVDEDEREGASGKSSSRRCCGGLFSSGPLVFSDAPQKRKAGQTQAGGGLPALPEPIPGGDHLGKYAQLAAGNDQGGATTSGDWDAVDSVGLEAFESTNAAVITTSETDAADTTAAEGGTAANKPADSAPPPPAAAAAVAAGKGEEKSEEQGAESFSTKPQESQPNGQGPEEVVDPFLIRVELTSGRVREIRPRVNKDAGQVQAGTIGGADEAHDSDDDDDGGARRRAAQGGAEDSETETEDESDAHSTDDEEEEEEEEEEE